ncbi:hypothetical protein [Paraliobacillus ryukyuensis]|uniref:hypothetical protein n=1 Tax=Paraliobacillus ryukyuensis TaxID=200904 RepID=UPI0009A86D91|nr:hypothetical protein [Paraliobacillus ryukyuensis]
MVIEDTSGETVNLLSLFLFSLVIVSITVYSIYHVQSIDFKNYVDAEIERNGGLTDIAVSNINDYSDQHYLGRFEVSSLSGNDKKPFGGRIDYVVQGEFSILFFDIPDQFVSTHGFAVSQVR